MYLQSQLSNYNGLGQQEIATNIQPLVLPKVAIPIPIQQPVAQPIPSSARPQEPIKANISLPQIVKVAQEVKKSRAVRITKQQARLGKIAALVAIGLFVF